LLAVTDVLSYLLQRDLASPQQLCDCDLVIEEISRRNRNLKILSKQGSSYLLKEGIGSDRTESVAHEAAIYELLLSDTSDEEVGGYLPYFYGYDTEQHILILEFLRDAQNLRAYHTRFGRFPPAIGEALGNALGTMHRRMRIQRKKPKQIPSPSRELPWIFFLHRPDLRIFRDISSANIQAIKIIQQFTEFGELLDKLRLEWHPQTLIHFDIKGDNCLVCTGQRTTLKIVDWELAGVGDACWDVGSVFMDYLSCWLLSIPITGRTPPDQFPELARYPLSRMQPAMRSFWQSYVRTMGLDSATSDEWLLRAVRYSAARLLQTAYEQMQTSIQLTGNIVCFLQLSLNILRRPQVAIVHLLGIPWRE
jgi:phosphotransferase family enzyme